MTFGDTIIPWLLGTFLLLSLLTLAVTIKSWRDIKRSPYFFLRRQAEKRLQAYSLASVTLILVSAVVSAYAWQTPPDNTPRVAILVNTKPPKEEIVAAVNASSVDEEVTVVLEPAASTQSVTTDVLPPALNEGDLQVQTESVLSDDSLLAEEPPVEELPEEFDQFEPDANLGDDTSIGQLLFDTEIGANYQAINPRRLFAEGNYTLYATFDYEDMVNGTEWFWVWRHNGTVVDGGNEIWNYGKSGPGYIYLSPPEGFLNGEYSLEIWVNGEKLAESSVIMNNAAVAAGN